MANQQGRVRREPVQPGDRIPVLRSRALCFVPLAIALLCAVAGVGGADAKVYLTRERALAQAFGDDATLESTSIFLDADAARRAETRAGAKLASARVTAWRAYRRGRLLGTAYLDTHLVRSMNETILVVVTPEQRVALVEVLAFNEPEDYLPPRRWLDTFDERTLSRDLKPGAALPSLGGSTLTARAVAAAVRRTLAVHAEVAVVLGDSATAEAR